MNADEYCGLHTVYYFVIAGIGLALIFLAKNVPTYNETTGEVIQEYSLPLVILGIILIVLSFIGLIWFCEGE